MLSISIAISLFYSCDSKNQDKALTALKDNFKKEVLSSRELLVDDIRPYHITTRDSIGECYLSGYQLY